MPKENMTEAPSTKLQFRGSRCTRRIALKPVTLARSKSLALLMAMGALPITGAADAPGCSDPAMFPKRMPNYSIASCKKGSDAVTLLWPGGKKSLMGLVTQLTYKVPNMADAATPKYIASNYANAVSSIGGTLLDDPSRSTLGDRMTAQIDVNGQMVWVQLSSESPVVQGKWQTYKLVVVQPDGAAQIISAKKMLDDLDKDGFVALYINFDTGLWTLKPDSQGLIEEVVALLRNQPNLLVSIDGHTDNVGDANSNQTLSEKRAKALLDAVVARGIEPKRLKSQGFGQSRPIADNRSEEGRAKNRRVELVKR